MQEKVLDKKTKHILDEIKKTKIVSNFYLAGGTALVLELEHRRSIDLDWFSQKQFSTKKLKQKLSGIGKLKINEETKDTLNCELDGVKLSFFEYPYKVLFPFVKCEGIRLADLKDIACMKIDAISSRGSKKDFIDMYFILKDFSIEQILSFFDKKYKGIEYNHLHILKSLTYFEEAERQPMPKMLKLVSWEKIKKEITEKVKEYLR